MHSSQKRGIVVGLQGSAFGHLGQRIGKGIKGKKRKGGKILWETVALSSFKKKGPRLEGEKKPFLTISVRKKDFEGGTLHRV